MTDNPDPTKDSAFKKVVDYFLRTPPQPQKVDVPKKRSESQRKRFSDNRKEERDS